MTAVIALADTPGGGSADSAVIHGDEHAARQHAAMGVERERPLPGGCDWARCRRMQ